MTNNRSRKRDIRERMAATGEVFSVAARRIDNAQLSPTMPLPWQAFYQGLGRAPYDEEPMKNFDLSYWVAAVYTIVTADWEGDTEPLRALGAAYKNLEDTQGNYFCYHHYTAEFFRYRFQTNAMEIGPGALKASYVRNRELFLYNHSVLSWFDDIFKDTDQANYEVISHISSLLDEDVRTAKDTNAWTSDGMLAFVVVWGAFDQYARTAWVEMLTRMISQLPPIEEANTDDILYNRYYKQPPVPRVDIQVGDKVKFKGDGLLWNARNVSENFIVLTTTIPENRKRAGENVYTIIDWTNSMRGAHNSFGHSTETDESIQKLIDDLELGLHPVQGTHPNFSETQLGRNSIPLRIQKVTSSTK